MLKRIESLMNINDCDVLCCISSNVCSITSGCPYLFSRYFTKMDSKLQSALVDSQLTVKHLSNEFIGEKLVSLVSFPICKLEDNRKSTSIIVNAAKELVTLADEKGWQVIRIPSFGFRFSSKSFKTIEKYLEKILDDRFIIHETIFEDELNCDTNVYSNFDKISPINIKGDISYKDKLGLIICGSKHSVDYKLFEAYCNKILRGVKNKDSICIVTRDNQKGVCKAAIKYANDRGLTVIPVSFEDDVTSKATREYVYMANLARKFKNHKVFILDIYGNKDNGPSLMKNICTEYGLSVEKIDLRLE